MGSKPFRTVEQQIEILKSRNVTFGNEARARVFLLRESYYVVVNGYKDALIDKERTNLACEDRFLPGTSFRHFELIYTFDKSLRNETMALLLDAESAMKTAVMYSFCFYYGGEDSYLDPQNYCARQDYRQEANYTKGLIRLLSTLQRIRDNAPHKEYIKHYSKKHNCVPLWVVSKCMTFGCVSAFFDYQRQSVKTKTCVMLAESLGKDTVGQKELAYSFHTLPEFRNICAHDERLYCSKVGKRRDKGFLELLRALRPVVDEVELGEYVRKVSFLLRDIRSESPLIADKLMRGMGVTAYDFEPYL